MTTNAVALILLTAFRHSIEEPNIESAFQRFALIAEPEFGYDTFCEAVASCLSEGLIHEPVRLPDGALQCHWHLELNAKGVASTRALLSTEGSAAGQCG